MNKATEQEIKMPYLKDSRETSLSVEKHWEIGVDSGYK